MVAEVGSGIEPIRRLKVPNSVASQLERLILRGHYPTGTRLPNERALAEQFGVGRSSMREALRLLESRRLLRIEHGIGAFVTNEEERGRLSDLLVVGDVTISELFEVRGVLEAESAAMAARRRSDLDVAALEKIIANAGSSGLSDAEFIELDSQLHRAVVVATQNPLFVEIYDNVLPRFKSYSARVIALPGRRHSAHLGHCKIVEAVVLRKMQHARKAALAHIQEVERDIAQFAEHSDDHVQGQER